MKIVWDKDRFNGLAEGVYWYSHPIPQEQYTTTGKDSSNGINVQSQESETMQEEDTPQELLDAEYEREIQLGPIIAVVEHLLNNGVTVEEVIRRLVTDK